MFGKVKGSSKYLSSKTWHGKRNTYFTVSNKLSYVILVQFGKCFHCLSLYYYFTLLKAQEINCKIQDNICRDLLLSMR